MEKIINIIQIIGTLDTQTSQIIIKITLEIHQHIQIFEIILKIVIKITRIIGDMVLKIQLITQ